MKRTAILLTFTGLFLMGLSLLPAPAQSPITPPDSAITQPGSLTPTADPLITSFGADGLVRLPRKTLMNYARRLTVPEELKLATGMLDEIHRQNGGDTLQTGNVLAVLQDVIRYQFRADSLQKQQQQRAISDTVRILQQQMLTFQQAEAQKGGSGMWVLFLVLCVVAAVFGWWYMGGMKNPFAVKPKPKPDIE